MASKFYAVKKGKIPGIYNSWDDCKKMVDGFPGAVYKSFKTLEEAEAFVGAEDTSRKRSEKAEKPDTGKQEQNPAVYAFVDGSYNIATKVYGYGGFLIHNGEKEVLQGSGNDAEMASMRNVSGEILGAMAAVERAIELKLPEVTIYYDYMGIEMWATGAWKRNKQGTIASGGTCVKPQFKSWKSPCGCRRNTRLCHQVCNHSTDRKRAACQD